MWTSSSDYPCRRTSDFLKAARSITSRNYRQTSGRMLLRSRIPTVTYGGLIFLGIKSDKNRNNVPVEWDGAQLGSDSSARVSSRILSSVPPRPEFDTGAVRSTNGDILIIRVKEGSYPPYEYEQGASVRIPIRVNDRKKQASVRDIEALIERRNATKESVQSASANLQPDTLFAYRVESLPGGGRRDVKDDRVHKMLLVPHRPTRWRLDVKFERQF